MAEKSQKNANDTVVKRPRGRPRKVQPQTQMIPEKEDVADILNEIGSRANLKTVLSALLLSSSVNQRKNTMSVVAESIVGSFNKYQNTVSNHIATKDVEFEIKFDSRKSIQSVLFTETMTGVVGGPEGQALNVNIDYFKDFYEQKRDPEPPKKYSKHEYVEYKYNVTSIIDYYTRRFPDILDLFDTFADICVNKSDIGVFVEFSDDFIKKFFVDEYQRQLDQKMQMKDMLARQAMGLSDLDQTTGEYNDFGEEVAPVSAESEDLYSSGDYTGGNMYPKYDMTSPNLKTVMNLFDAQGNKVDLKTIKKSLGSTLQQDDNAVDDYVDDTTPLVNNDMTIYDEVYDGVTYQYQLLLTKVEKKIRKVLDNRLIKKVKYATKIADIWGYSIITINKTDPDDISIYNPSELRIYKKKKSSLDLDNLIFGKIEITDGTNQKIKVLNYGYNCYVLSLDPMVMMPIPNIVRISWYLYLMDLVEILMIYNDLIKSKSVHLLEIPVFESNGPDPNGDGVTASNMMDSISVMNMIINNIESKLVLDTDYIKGENSEDVAMKMLKNVGLSVAYVPKLSPTSEMKDIKLDTDDQQYNKLYTMLSEKIFSVLKFPLWFRTSTQVMETFKAIPREVVQFAHLIFMSRVNSALSELEAFLEYMVMLHVDEYRVSYFGSEEEIPVELESIKVKMRSILGEYLFDNAKTEQIRSTKIQSLLTLTSSGLTLNPHWVCEWIFPEWTMGEVLLDVGQTLASKRQQIDNALNGNSGETTNSDQELEGSDLADESGDSTTPSDQSASTEFDFKKLDWDKIRASFASALIGGGDDVQNHDSPQLKNIKRRVDQLVRLKSFRFNIKRV